MAMMDNAAFLVNHIRNSFITSDDTGMCELIIETDGHPEKAADKRSGSWHINRHGITVSVAGDSGLSDSSVDASLSDGGGGRDSEAELSHSYDILPDMDFGHRRRSNTAMRLERLKKEKHKQSKIKHIPWKEVDHSFEDVAELFKKKDFDNPLLGATSSPTKTVKKRSLLSDQLERYAEIPNNPFSEFAKFDGRASSGIPTKKIDIFLTIASEKDRPYPMTVITMVTAKVQDLIGLICWQYTNEGRQPRLSSENIESYCLHIAEDDGEVDADFPALDNKEPISKFGFARLALVMKDVPPTPAKPSRVVTINLPNGDFSQIQFDTDTVLMRDIMEVVMKKRKKRPQRVDNYKLEKQREPGVAIDLDLPLSEMQTNEFFMLRKNSSRSSSEPGDIPRSMSALAESLSSHQYQSYRVSMAHKLRTNTEVQLGVSGEKIEIDPVSNKSLLFRQKAVTYDTDDICACVLLDEKNTAKSSFRLVYSSGPHEYKHHDFECDASTARKIVNKINNILEMRSSPTRKDYLLFKETKKLKRYSSHT